MLRQKSNRRVKSASKDMPVPIMEPLEARQMMSATVPTVPVEGQLWTPHPFQFSYAGSTASQWKFQIYWGDNTGVQTAKSIVHNPEAGNLPGYFQTTMSHTYDESGDYTIETTEYFKGKLWQTTDYPIQVSDAPLIANNISITVQRNAVYSGSLGSFTDGSPINPDSKISDFSVADVIGGDTVSLQKMTPADVTLYTISTGKYGLKLNKPFHLAWSGGPYKIGVVVRDRGGSLTVVYCTVNTASAPAAVSSAQTSTTQSSSSPFSSDALISPLSGVLDL